VPEEQVLGVKSALHYSTGAERGSDVGFSSMHVPYYQLLVSDVFRVHSDSSKWFRMVRKWSRSSEVIRN